MQRAEQGGLARRFGALFTIGPSEQRFIAELNNANTGAFELVLTPLIFAGIGVLIDRALGTAPLVALVFGLVGFAGACYRLYLEYTARMKKAEEGKPWAKQ